ncbi:OmpA family protein [Mucilaginibacter sp. ZT4R22]|uniref:OmpA family protein n=1 Tax=Mucilaginibacter pankratovii TaxID=2772110 RepID=A0ABR7WP75_9SPHI|nr:OmpA family protein [Mucilaginibacter pankratovii]MBD1363092.1 OmpA family protein [Mucilaginibacter pankratovii]
MKKAFFGVTAVVMLLQFYNAEGAPFVKPHGTHKVSKKSKLSIDGLTKNVQFAFCEASVPMIDSTQLNQLAQFLTENKYAISLRGHADAIGSYLGNWKMSEARAVAIKEYLVKKGVLEDRIVTTAFGSTIPIADNKTSNGRKKNRRVEMRLKAIGA